MAILNHGSTIRTADGGQSTTTIVTASNIGTYGIAANSTYFIGTTQNVFNRASGAQTLTGVSIDGNAATVTNGVYTTGAQTIGGTKTFSDGVIVNGATYYTFNKPTTTNYQTVALFGSASAGLFLTTDSAIIGTGAYYNAGWIATATSGRHIDFAGGTFNFNVFSGATVGGTATWGSVATLNSSGTFSATGDFRAPIFYDTNNTAYYLDAASTSSFNALNLASTLAINGGDGIRVFKSPASSVTSQIYWANGANTIAYNWQIDENNNAAMWGYGGTAWAKLLTVTSGGGVGIGTSTISQKLNISGNIMVAPVSSSWAEGLSFTMPTASTWGGLRWRREVANNDGNHYVGYTGLDSTDDLVFGSNNAGTQINNNIRITKAGLVGIGTAPSQKFHVSGIGYSDTDFRAPIFYDSNNTAYFCDPSSTSNLNVVTLNNSGSGGYLNLPGSISVSNVSAAEMVIRGLSQLRFSNSTSWDWNAWAGLRYDNATTTIYLGGPAATGIFTQNATPPTVTVSFVGTNNVTSDSNFKGPIFYDSANTAYYLDPNNTGTSMVVAGKIFAAKGNFSDSSGSGAVLEAYNTVATNATTAIIRQTTAGGNGNQDIGLLVDIQGAGDTDRIANFRYYDGSTYTSRMAIMRGGNVGIGTTSPGAKLEIYNGDLWLNAAGSSINPEIRFIDDSGISVAGAKIRYNNTDGNIYFEHVYNNASSGIFFRNRTAGTALETLTLVNGNVGIGATGPDTNLQVVGHVHVGNQTTFENTGGWNKTIYLDGTIHARMRILGSAYASGKNSATETSIWVDNSVAPYSGLTTNAGSFTISAGFTTLTNSARSPIFYDSDNTAYYIDAASTSVLNKINLNSAGVASIQWRAAGVGTITGGFPFYNNASYGSINIEVSDNDTGGLVIDNEGVTVYGAADNGQLFRTIDEDVYQSNGNNITAATTFWINQGADGGGAIRGSFTSTGDFRAPIFYDSNNTSYYIDAASTSNLNALTVAGGNATIYRDLIINGGASGNFGNRIIVQGTATTYTLQDSTLRPTIYLNGSYPVLTLNGTATSNDNHGPTIQFTFNGLTTGGSTSRQIVIGADGTGSRLDFGFSGGGYGTNSDYNPHNGIAGYSGITAMRLFSNGLLVGNTGAYPNEITSTSYALDVRGTGYSNTDFRAPIFYDSDNTAYYINAASTSVLNALTVGGNNVLTTASTLTAGNLSGTIPSAVLGNSTLYVGTTAIALNRGSASQTLTGTSIDGNAATATTATNSTQLGGVAAANYVRNDVDGSNSTALFRLTTITKSLTITTSWLDTGIVGADLATGCYMISVYVDNYAVSGGHYQETYTGMMSWFSTGTNSTDYDEIVLHKSGHASNGAYINLRTIRQVSGGTNLKLQIISSVSTSGASNYVFKFRRLI